MKEKDCLWIGILLGVLMSTLVFVMAKPADTTLYNQQIQQQSPNNLACIHHPGTIYNTAKNICEKPTTHLKPRNQSQGIVSLTITKPNRPKNLKEYYINKEQKRKK